MPLTRIMLIGIDGKNKRNGKGSDSLGSDSPRAKKILHNIDS
jgi:hypothetical protein